MPTHAIIKNSQPELVSVYEKAVILTDAQIKALPTTGIELVPSPGAGKLLNIISSVWVFTSSGGYGGISGDAEMYLSYGGTVYASAQALESRTEVSAMIGGAGTVSFVNARTGPDAEPVVGGSPGDSVDKSINITVTNALGDFTGGNAANTLKVTVCYIIVDLV